MAADGRSRPAARSEGKTRGKPTVSIVGAGRLGTALARALARNGYTIESVVARRKRSAERAARLVGTRPLALSSAELDRLPASDILLIITQDDAIADTAARLADLFPRRPNDDARPRPHTALHASGALSSEVLRALRGVGFATGSVHPLVSVSDARQGADSFASAFFCVEGEPRAARVARSIVRALGGRSFSISARDKALYHAAAVMASGHTTALFDIATEMLTRCGLAERRARAVLLPLLRSTLENLYTSDPAGALTGTFARADTATVRRHLASLRSQKMTDALAAYVLLGRRSLRLAKAAGANNDALNEIARALGEAESGKRKAEGGKRKAESGRQ
ncbi:MAG TPA: DUF2520 domain-containing protein [Pyrinomonadaceae bacterium]|nr:DUF2520 domain-containing protein [Pyrinomonadaceae bacterium]